MFVRGSLSSSALSTYIHMKWNVSDYYSFKRHCNVSYLLSVGLRKDNIGLREVTSSGYSSEQPRTEIRLYRKLTCIHSLSVVMADDVGEIKTSNVC